MTNAQIIVRRFFTLLAVSSLFATVPRLYAKAYFASESEMIALAEIIAIVNISGVEQAETRSTSFNYYEIAHATVEQTLKGTLPKNVKLYGAENFICAQVRYTPGRRLVFLQRNGDLLAGCNWHLGVRPIKGDEVEWYKPGERLGLSWQPLDAVLARIKKSIK